jgi:hypothetical protein
MARPFHPGIDALPAILPIFPLPGVLLLPDGKLPLNIFEPRYLSLVTDALGKGRLFGMVQPTGEPADGSDPPIFDTGCAGRISAFSETEDGRLLITLTGVCRYHITDEVEGLHGYRRVAVDWRPFAADLDDPPAITLDRRRLLAALKTYSRLNHLDFNWKAIERVEDYDLSVSLSMACPFEPREKQALLECPHPAQRAETLITLMEMAVAERQGGGGQVPQ